MSREITKRRNGSGRALTIGAHGEEAVTDKDQSPALDFGHACLRTLMWLVLAVPAGLGFLTAIASQDHRGLHDRFAGTRVVRASA